MDEQILTDADLKALEPGERKYLTLDKAVGHGNKPVKVSAHRILAVHGGTLNEARPQFSLELANRSGKPTVTVFNGHTDSVFAQFNTLGVRKDFLVFEEVNTPLPRMAREKAQPSAVRVALINSIRRHPSYRSQHGYKVSSQIERLDARPLLAFEDVGELAAAIVDQGFIAAPSTSIAVFMLHPDQPALLNDKGQRLARPKAPRRRLTPVQKTLI